LKDVVKLLDTLIVGKKFGDIFFQFNPRCGKTQQQYQTAEYRPEKCYPTLKEII
jgi:hypothetical protein